MKFQLLRGMAWFAVCACLGTASANNIVVTNVTLIPVDTTNAYVQADVSWDHSWRASWTETAVTPSVAVTNWDAAWVFVKYSVQGVGTWQHASLSTNGADHLVVSGIGTMSVGQSTNSGGTDFGCGVFLHRAADGNGSWTNRVKLLWNFARDGLASTARVMVSAGAIEMVYVPQGSFYAGDGLDSEARLHSNNVASSAFLVPGEAAVSVHHVSVDGGAGTLGVSTMGNSQSENLPFTLPTAFPKGYNAFYCMKYDVTQGQWVDFFNTLTGTQKATRDITGAAGKNSQGVVNRNTVAWAGATASATCTTPDRGCNWVSWQDACAYAAWAGLRPMSDLEYEKACRGPLTPVQHELAWGNSTATKIAGINNDGTGTDTAAGGGCSVSYNSGLDGPVRAGIFATSSSTTRTATGASYWGIMELSGNVNKLVVSLSHNGTAFNGSTGSGTLASNGDAVYGTWPSTDGFLRRGGSWGEYLDANFANWGLSVRFDYWSNSLGSTRKNVYGIRCVRQAPAGE